MTTDCTIGDQEKTPNTTSIGSDEHQGAQSRRRAARCAGVRGACGGCGGADARGRSR